MGMNKPPTQYTILIITQGVSPLVFSLIESPHIIAGIVESAPRKKEKNILKKLYARLRYKKSLQFFCSEHKLPYFYMTKKNTQQLEQWVKKLNPDLIAVYSMSQLLKENIYSIPRLGTLNLHPSYLPSYRGPNPWFWMYYYMEKKGGITIHTIDRGEDTGSILAQKTYPIAPGTPFENLKKKAIEEVGIPLYLETINTIELITPTSQPKESPTIRARNLKKKERSHMIDWENWPIERIWHLLRGFSHELREFDLPSGIYRGQKWNVEEYKKLSHDKPVKSILKEGKRFALYCRDGKIYLRPTASMRRFLFSFFC